MQQNRFKRDGRVFKCQTFGTLQVLRGRETFIALSKDSEPYGGRWDFYEYESSSIHRLDV